MNGSFLILAYCSPRLHCFAGKKEQHCIHQNYLSDCFEKPLRFIESSKSKNNIESIKHFLSSLHKYRNRHSFFFSFFFNITVTRVHETHVLNLGVLPVFAFQPKMHSSQSFRLSANMPTNSQSRPEPGFDINPLLHPPKINAITLYK